MLHIAVYELLPSQSKIGTTGKPESLELIFIPPPVPAGPVALPGVMLLPYRPSRTAQKVPPRIDVTPDVGRSKPSENESAVPPDWAAELEREAREPVPGEPPSREFGFPHRSRSTSAKALEFGWDHAHTHRVEALPGGGLIINVSDECVIVFNPLPFFGCGFGKKEALGDLFKHMRDP